jgi:hypothetical protein
VLLQSRVGPVAVVENGVVLPSQARPAIPSIRLSATAYGPVTTFFAEAFLATGFEATAFFSAAFLAVVFLPATFALAASDEPASALAIKNFVRSWAAASQAGAGPFPLHVAPVLGSRYFAGCGPVRWPLCSSVVEAFLTAVFALLPALAAVETATSAAF